MMSIRKKILLGVFLLIVFCWFLIGSHEYYSAKQTKWSQEEAWRRRKNMSNGEGCLSIGSDMKGNPFEGTMLFISVAVRNRLQFVMENVDLSQLEKKYTFSDGVEVYETTFEIPSDKMEAYGGDRVRYTFWFVGGKFYDWSTFYYWSY